MRRRRIFQRRGADSHPGTRIPPLSLSLSSLHRFVRKKRRDTRNRVSFGQRNADRGARNFGIAVCLSNLPNCPWNRAFMGRDKRSTEFLARLLLEERSIASCFRSWGFDSKFVRFVMLRNAFRSGASKKKNAFCFLLAVDSFLCNILINPFDFSLTRSAWFFFFWKISEKYLRYLSLCILYLLIFYVLLE